MSYIKKYPNGFIDRWGNYRRKGSGDSSPVIGKSGPRPELRTLTYGVGINDVMIAEFSSSLCDNYFNIKCSEVSLNHVSYLSSWYKGLKKDPTKLISACSKAEEAFNFLVEATEKELNNMNKKVA